MICSHCEKEVEEYAQKVDNTKRRTAEAKKRIGK